MSVLAPLFLWLLPLAAIPLLIHLLNKRNLITIDFSTLRFLRMLEKESIRKLKLLQIILLILRTIIILLVVFMITRPVMTGTFNNQYSEVSSLHAFIIDDSFSMQGDPEIIYKTALTISQNIPGKSQLIWINLNKGILYSGLKEDMPPLDKLLSYTYNTGSIVDALNILKHNIKNEYISKEIYILTDHQNQIIKEIIDNSERYHDMNLYILLNPLLNDNLAITNVKILNEILLPNQTIDLEVSVKNTGITNKNNVLLQLIIDNMSVGQQLISLPVNNNSIFLFKTALPKTGSYKAMVEMDTDGREGDNRYYINLNIPDRLNIALICNLKSESFYIRASMESLNKKGESINIYEYQTLDDPNLNLSNLDVLYIISPNILNTWEDSKLEEYLYNGGHVVILPSSNTTISDYSIVNNLLPQIDGNYQNLSLQELSGESFQDINLSSIQLEGIYNLFLSATGQERNIRLFKYLGLPYGPEYSQILLNDGNPIWNRYNVHSGIIDVFGFAMDLEWSNFPIKGTFLPFFHFITYSQNRDIDELSHIVGTHWEVIPEDYYYATIYHLMPDGSREIINYDEKNILVTEQLKNPGYHSLEADSFIIKHTAVNIDETELNFNYTTIETLKENKIGNMQFISMQDDILAEIKHARIGSEIWRYILYLIIIFVIIEMLISNVQKQK